MINLIKNKNKISNLLIPLMVIIFSVFVITTSLAFLDLTHDSEYAEYFDCIYDAPKFYDSESRFDHIESICDPIGTSIGNNEITSMSFEVLRENTKSVSDFLDKSFIIHSVLQVFLIILSVILHYKFKKLNQHF